MTTEKIRPVFESNLKNLELLGRGKVRDMYKVNEDSLLIVTTDRISAFDVILKDPIPGKGIALTAISNFWFEKLSTIIPNHLTNEELNKIDISNEEFDLIKDRSIIVKKLNPLPIESVIRGYLIGSGWKDYCNTSAVSGISLPKGLKMAQKLSEPIFTPSTKAEVGAHDENISSRDVVSMIGKELTEKVKKVSLELYSQASKYALKKGIIIADTKFEFGLDNDDNLYLIDELFTPDSSRFWPVKSYKLGSSPKSFDKQYIRDYLETLDWNKEAPGPQIPEKIGQKTSEKYFEAFDKLTG
ncbi:MAG: phosphoribosylaminoimidazolesuccinocarboxamide synthase [Pseudomonadota bacterium]|nr:phosphoribosylaminoimidazolesuccinocarboxamide synthase [Gammaproteobacteria bacterium]MEE2684102.1 phosphoribosylaminoimidazolesuccinocarboxamide synthase [Pseudomonadota bacterium]|tara:strand:+ start:1047 stop:1943 length:897 start_codon:yes stop_codon:yes gene_type:complete